MSKWACGELVGTPFKEFGRGPDFLDCWGGLISTGKYYGVAIPDYGSIFEEHAQGEKVVAHRGEWTEVADPRPGDVIEFKPIDGEAHFGMVVEDAHFAHVTRVLGYVIMPLHHSIYSQLIKGYYRWIPQDRK